MLLEDEVLARIQHRQSGLVELLGPFGSGKSTALAHLALLFGNEPRLKLVDRPEAGTELELRAASVHELIIVAPILASAADAGVEQWRLAPWSGEDCAEYLLASHRSQCAEVMRRLNADSHWSKLRGSPELCRPVLDHLAQDKTLTNAKAALRRELESHLRVPGVRKPVGEYCADVLSESSVPGIAEMKLMKSGSADPALRALLRHNVVQVLLAAEHLAWILRTRKAATVLCSQHTDVLIREIAELLREDKETLARLAKLAVGSDHACHAMSASLLHAANMGWTPDGQQGLLLMGAYLPRAQWSHIRLLNVDLSHADLEEADLTEANLKDISARETSLDQANLSGSSLDGFVATNATLSHCDLSFARVTGGQFQSTSLFNANLEGARLPHANFENADLTGARFCRASLTHALFVGTLLEDADFSGADFSFAELVGLPMRLATFAGARFYTSTLLNCDLEFMILPGAVFHRAVLKRSHLTGSQMPNADLFHADLRETGLAEIEWERADLRGADFRGATFHMGSSRSGLVGSPIACEGSKTGFYTDEYHEQDFKAPEEIRKANLCGADLRGAIIDNVDFYLVDLRGARYTSDQADHFRRCGAILEARV